MGFNETYLSASREAVGYIKDRLTIGETTVDAIVGEASHTNDIATCGFAESRGLRATILRCGAPALRLGGIVRYEKVRYRITSIERDLATIDLELQDPDE